VKSPRASTKETCEKKIAVQHFFGRVAPFSLTAV